MQPQVQPAVMVVPTQPSVGVMSTTANAGGTRQVADEEIQAELGHLWWYGLGMLIAGIIGLGTFWSVYYLGVIPAGVAVGTGIIQMTRTGSVAAVRSHGGCATPNKVFSNLHSLNVFCLICGAISSAVTVLAIIFHKNWWFSFVREDWFLYVCIVGLVGALLGTAMGALSFQGCDRLHTLVIQDSDINPTVVVHQPVVLPPQQHYYAQPGVAMVAVQQQPTQQAYPAAGSAPPPQAYPQSPAPAYGAPPQPQGYPQQGQPVYGAAQYDAPPQPPAPGPAPQPKSASY